MNGALGLVLLALVGCDNQNLQQVKPRLSPPGSPVDFGLLPVLNQKRVEIPLTNVGRAKMNVSNITLGKADGIFRLEAKPELVESGVTENIVVVFTPVAEATYEDTLDFDTDDEDNKHITLALTGVGSTKAIIELQPPMLDFGRVAECASTVQLITILSKGTADLVIEEIAFTDGTSPAFSFVGSTRTPATVQTIGSNGLPGQIQLTVRVSAAATSEGTLTGGIRIRSTDPEQRELIIPLTATVNRAPVANIAMLGNGAPGQRITLDGTASMDPDGDDPITYKWTIRSKPLASSTTIAMPDAATTEMTLDAMVPGAYEVQLDVTDSTGAKSCQPARATVVAAPAQKLLVEMFWDNPGTDLDLHVLRNSMALLNTTPDDCYYQNRTPDWGLVGDTNDDPQLVRDALTGYGPEVFGYVNPVDGTYRVAVMYENELLSPMPASTVTVRVYLFGILKAERSKTLQTRGTVWEVVDVTWPSGDVTVLP
ncbi:MAG: choice-of-anchor D domain-containing protein [Archangium sp.]|nr:choice-of-anchor D domain-containing protein [Archangium sp.]